MTTSINARAVQNSHFRNDKVASMRLTSPKRLSLLSCLALVALSVGCTQGQDDVIQVQTNLVDKGIFEGEWWVLQSVVDADGDATEVGSAASIYMFDGGSAFTDLALDQGQSAAIGRIRWVVDENFLYAYRSYELIDGGNDDGGDPEFRGQPLAAFAIEDHVDIRYSYSGLTGERTNVLVENTSDRRWYERDYVRVDWSMNHAQSFALLQDWVDFGSNWRQESVPFFIENTDSHNDFPDSYAPQFVRVQDDPEYRWRHEWPEGTEETIHYMSFTSMLLFSPGDTCLYAGGGVCQTVAVPVRTAFLRVPPEHDYAAATQSHDQFDRFGLFRTYQRSYIRGGTTDIVCESDAECGARGFCDLEVNTCSGLGNDYGETDFLTFMRPMHNFYMDGLTDQVCRADFQCAGTGSMCDPSAKRCTIPVRDRELNQVTYHLSDGFPSHLVRSAYETVGNWNEVFMRGWRAARGLSVPDYGAGTPIACQNANPTAYCFCGSADQIEGTDTCRPQFDPFMSAGEWADAGVPDAFDCQISNSDFADPANPTSYDDYTIPAVYHYEFTGSECMFVLKSNSCDMVREDAGVQCDDVVDADGARVAWQQQGDIRYQYFNYIDQVGTLFGGVSELRSDPTTGELITADANYAGSVSENIATRVIEWFPVLRCVNPLGCAPGEEGADERYLTGENMRDYFEGLDQTERPVGIAPSGSGGTGETDDFGRPRLPAGSGLRNAMMNLVHDAIPRIEQMHGEEGRFNSLSGRMQNLAGSPLETQFMEALGPQAMQAHFANTAGSRETVNVADRTRVMDEDILNRISPFRGNGFVDELSGQRAQETQIGAMSFCFRDLADPKNFQRSRSWEYWSEAFRGRPTGEASVRMQQMYMKAVMHHELGHSVGLRHNFGGSFDRNNYGDGYYNLVVDGGLALPRLDRYDDPSNGGNSDGFVGGPEFTNYYDDLREVRNQRSQRGAQNYMTGSIMDYNGDLSDMYGLGRYDKAAVSWSYFDLVEAYVGDPRIRAGDSTNELHRTHVTDRVMWKSYEGGESCVEDTQCPNTFGSPELVAGQPVYQRCIRNPRNSPLPTQCAGDVNCICSNFEEDFLDYQDGAAYDNDVDGDRALDHFPVEYMFCSDERTVDISWCSAFDAGESFQESLDNYRRTWYEGYANAYNRRFVGVRTGNSVRSVQDAAKIYQHLFFRLFYEPGFQSNDGPLGFLDQVQASVDSMNWFIELVNLPDRGSYSYDAANEMYRFISDEEDMPDTDLTLGEGRGFGMWTEFQDGHQGFFRAERGGVFWDKYFALYALAIRDWGLSFTVDERYYINYYDLFAIPITEFFGGIITDQPSWYAPRYHEDTGVIEHMGWYRGLLFGTCTGPGGATRPCLPSQEEVYPTSVTPAIGGTTNIILRSWATALALAQFSVYYDASFEQRLLVFKLGDGNAHDIPDVRPDGSPACALGDFTVEPGHELVSDGLERCNSLEDATYAVFNSDRLHFSYVAVKVRPRVDYNLEEEQLGFEMLANLIELQDAVRALEGAGPSEALSEARERLFESESFLEYLIDLQNRYGISNFL